MNANVLKASEDKTFPGAIVASMTSPWGQAISAGDPGNTYFGSYREVFARDLYEIWTGLMADGDLATARDATLFLFQRQQQADGSMPRNSLLNGKTAPDSFGTQLDETSYPLLMADELHLTDASLYADHIKPAANFVASHGPAFGVERWEEQDGYSPSTIAAEIAGLIAAADLADANHDPGLGGRLARRRRRLPALDQGLDGDHERPARAALLHPPLQDRRSERRDLLQRRQRRADARPALGDRRGLPRARAARRAVRDRPGHPRLAARRGRDDPLGHGERPRLAPLQRRRLRGPLERRPPVGAVGASAPGTSGRRCRRSAPSSRCRPATRLARRPCSTAWTSSPAASASSPSRTGSARISPPRRFGTPPETASIGFVNGEPAGSAGPLNWSAASFVRLFADIGAGRLGDRPRSTYQRYVAHTQGTTPLTVTSPADLSAVSASPVTVTGTTAPGNAVYVTATNTDTNSATTSASTTADAGGAFSVDVAVTGGTTVLNVVAVSASGGTAHVKRSVVFDFVPGTLLLDVTDPSGDDNGPGNYAYPTFSGFHPGAFDIQEFQVFDDGTNVIFRVKVRDLSPTFGSPLGAQLVDVYVHDPGAAPGSTSTAAANASRNFQIAPAYAWSRLIQVQGFGQRYENASGAPLGTVAISANQISRFITFRVTKASLGSPGPGWAFTVVLTGQDGFSRRPGAGLPVDAAGLPVRRLRGGELGSALHGRPRTPSRRRST